MDALVSHQYQIQLHCLKALGDWGLHHSKLDSHTEIKGHILTKSNTTGRLR